ncbi:MAG: leucine-rich repeat domain-containing protein [Bacteroidota bacterium]
MLLVLLTVLSVTGFSQNLNTLKKLEVAPDRPEEIQAIIAKKADTLLLIRLLPQLVNLEILDISSSKLNILPEGICNLTRLRELRLGNNNINVIPDCICKLKNLTVLTLWDNNVYKIPDCLATMPKLKQLDLYGMEYNFQEQADLKAKFPNLRIIFSEPCNCHFEEE